MFSRILKYNARSSNYPKTLKINAITAIKNFKIYFAIISKICETCNVCIKNQSTPCNPLWNNNLIWPVVYKLQCLTVCLGHFPKKTDQKDQDEYLTKGPIELILCEVLEFYGPNLCWSSSHLKHFSNFTDLQILPS